MAHVLTVREVGDPVLRRRARPLTAEEVRSEWTQSLIEAMRDTLRDMGGVGLAAPQVGEAVQVVVIEMTPQKVEASLDAERIRQGRTPIPLHVLINPVLAVDDAEMVDELEGCMSLGRLVMGVRRHRRVRVDALDEAGAPVSKRASDWYARILQHEIDHLHGRLCIDMADMQSLTTFQNMAQFWKGRTPQEVRDALSAGALPE